MFTTQERSERLEIAQEQKFVLARRKRAHSLFEVWDHDRSGYLELEELQLVLSRWKGFSTEEAQEHGEEEVTVCVECAYCHEMRS